MKLNAKQTQLIIVDFTCAMKSQNWKFLLDGAQVETVSSARLFGVTFNCQLTRDGHVNSIVTSIKTTMDPYKTETTWVQRKITHSTSQIVHHLNTGVCVPSLGSRPNNRPILYYRANIVEDNANDLWQQSKNGLHTDYDSDKSTLGLIRLDSRRKDAIFSSEMSILNTSDHPYWLPPLNEGKSRVRRHNIFDPVRASTTRYQNSPIPYFVNLLNEKFFVLSQISLKFVFDLKFYTIYKFLPLLDNFYVLAILTKTGTLIIITQ